MLREVFGAVTGVTHILLGGNRDLGTEGRPWEWIHTGETTGQSQPWEISVLTPKKPRFGGSERGIQAGSFPQPVLRARGPEGAALKVTVKGQR